MKLRKFKALIGSRNSRDADKVKKEVINVEASTYQEAHKDALLHHCNIDEEVIRVYDDEYVYYTIKNGFRRYKKRPENR